MSGDNHPDSADLPHKGEKLRHLAAPLALIWIGLAAPASAASFAFQFDNGGQGPVGVVIRGLLDDATSSATSVSVTLNDGGGYGLGEYLSVYLGRD